MGTLGKAGSNQSKLNFDGRAESWPTFKKALYQFLDKEGLCWVVEGGDVFCAMLQAASGQAARKKSVGKGTVLTNVADCDAKELQKAFVNASLTTSIQLELLANRKTVIGTHHADHKKQGMKEDQLTAAHSVLDAKRLTLVNRTIVRELYDAVYPDDSETPVTTSKLRYPQDTRGYEDPHGRKTGLQVGLVHQALDDQCSKLVRPLASKFEGMTDTVNGAFMEDLSELLNSATGDQRLRRTFREIDTEFEKMISPLLKNFESI